VLPFQKIKQLKHLTSTMAGFLPTLLVTIIILLTVNGSTDTCETIDGDCPDDCIAAGFNGTLAFTALLHVSPFHPSIEQMASKAETYIQSQGNVSSVDQPLTGLHTSLFYFCCHTQEEKDGIMSSLHAMEWNSFPVTYDSFACNLDHNNVTVYLHGLPTNQTDLFNLAYLIEDTVEAAGYPINHPRKSLFHMTLARVGFDYPVDDVVNYFLDDPEDWYFGSLVLRQFTIENQHYTSSDFR
jgi:2'-5' RNA ligase